MLSQQEFCYLDCHAFDEVPSAVTIDAVAVQVSVPDPLFCSFQIFVIAGAAHVEICQYFVYSDDSFTQFPHLEKKSIVIMDAQLAKRVFFVAFRPDEGHCYDEYLL